jgi:type II secretory pathway component PulM
MSATRKSRGRAGEVCMESLRKLVVISHSPRRRAIVIGAVVFAVLLILYGAFEFGRYDAGFRVVDSVRSALTASARIRELEAQIASQRAQLEAAEVARISDREGYKQIERSLGDMQSQIARLNQDLSFYRGLVQPDSITHVKVQQMQIVPQAAAGQYQLKFVLTQAGKPDGVVAGSAAITLDGLLQGKPTTLSFAQVTPTRRVSLAYSFRYFQDYDEPIQLPKGFEPTRIGVEIQSGRDRDLSHSFRQAFVWKAQGMSVETEAGGMAAKGVSDVQTETE